MKTKKKRPAIRLGGNRPIKLYKFLVNNKKKAETLTKYELAELATEKLGFPVTDHHVYKIASEAGVCYKHRPRAGVGPFAKRLAELEATTELLMEQVEKLEGRIK